MFYDAHNHLQDDWLAPHLPAIVDALERWPIAGAVVNGTHPDDWPRVFQLSLRHRWIHPSYGLHPWQVGRPAPDWHAQLEAHLRAEPHAHVGEIGLDRWILDNARPDDPRLADTRPATLEEQVSAFRAQLQLARAYERVASVHCLQAWGLLQEEMTAAHVPTRGFLLHAYGGSRELVPVWVKLGAYFSFSPAFLDPRKTRQRDAFRLVPLDRLLVETDAPAMPPPENDTEYPLPPDSATGCRVNHPGSLRRTYAALAKLREMPEPELREQVQANFRRLFG